MFADDTTIVYSSKVDAKTEQILNTELNKVKDWLNCNKLSLNVDKSSYLKFSNVTNSFKVDVKIAKRPVEQKKVAKYLGVLIDEKLTWKYHIGNINLKIRRGIGMLNKIKDYIPSSTTKNLYYSFVYPYLDYNLINWSSAPISYLKCLNTSNKKAIRTISFKKSKEHTNPLFKKYEILPLHSLIKLRRGIFMWKLDNKIFSVSNHLWYKPNTAPIYSDSNISKYLLPNPRTEFAKRHNTFSAIKLWNVGIPNKVKSSPFLSVFKKRYKALLLSSI